MFLRLLSNHEGTNETLLLSQELAEAEKSLERAKEVCDRYPLGVDFVCRKRIEFKRMFERTDQ